VPAPYSALALEWVAVCVRVCVCVAVWLGDTGGAPFALCVEDGVLVRVCVLEWLAVADLDRVWECDAVCVRDLEAVCGGETKEEDAWMAW
jgi:hypothetical protein